MRLGVQGPAAPQTVAPARRLAGSPTLPGDKSISHRALILTGISEGIQSIEGLSRGGDVLATASVLRALGAAIPAIDPSGPVRVGPCPGLTEAEDVLDCGNAGTTMRLLAGLLAGQPFLSVLTGDGSLRSRPMARVLEPLRALGAQVDGRDGGRKAPLVIRGGGLQGARHVSRVASAQVKSCLMLAMLNGEGTLVVDEPHRSRDHTERMLAACGVELQVEDTRVSLRGGQPLSPPPTLTVPTDLSAAAFFAVAAAIVPGSELLLRDVGVNPTRTGLLDVLAQAGVDVEVASASESWGEPRADLRVRAGLTAPLDVRGAVVPRLIDEIPVLAVLAARAPGRSVFADAADLRAKESDRIATTAAMLRAFGVAVQETDDGLIVDGDPDRPLSAGAVVDAHGDHRIAMAAAVAALCAAGPATLRGVQAVDTSFPGFFATLDSLRA